MAKVKSKDRRRTPKASSEAARNRMVAAKPRDTKPELALRAALEEQGLTFTVDVRPDPATRRRADILFERVRVAVYVDGCFWHGCPLHGTWPKQNAEFWRNKIETNQQRDVDTDRKLTEAGWCVIRVWEHEVMAEAARRIAEIVSKLDHTQRPPQLDLARS